KSGEPLELPFSRLEFNHDVAALDVIEVTQSLAEGLWEVRAGGQIGRHARYSRYFGFLLSARAQGPHYGSAKHSHELPPLHSITSPARASNVGGKETQGLAGCLQAAQDLRPGRASQGHRRARRHWGLSRMPLWPQVSQVRLP